MSNIEAQGRLGIKPPLGEGRRRSFGRCDAELDRRPVGHLLRINADLLLAIAIDPSRRSNLIAGLAEIHRLQRGEVAPIHRDLEFGRLGVVIRHNVQRLMLGVESGDVGLRLVGHEGVLVDHLPIAQVVGRVQTHPIEPALGEVTSLEGIPRTQLTFGESRHNGFLRGLTIVFVGRERRARIIRLVALKGHFRLLEVSAFVGADAGRDVVRPVQQVEVGEVRLRIAPRSALPRRELRPVEREESVRCRQIHLGTRDGDFLRIVGIPDAEARLRGEAARSEQVVVGAVGTDGPELVHAVKAADRDTTVSGRNIIGRERLREGAVFADNRLAEGLPVIASVRKAGLEAHRRNVGTGVCL